jgi:hypothetical protein
VEKPDSAGADKYGDYGGSHPMAGQIVKRPWGKNEKMILLDNNNLKNKFAKLFKNQQRKRLHKSKKPLYVICN